MVEVNGNHGQPNAPCTVPGKFRMYETLDLINCLLRHKEDLILPTQLSKLLHVTNSLNTSQAKLNPTGLVMEVRTSQ